MRARPRPRCATALLLVGLLLAGAACGGGEDEAESTSTTTTTLFVPPNPIPAVGSGLAPLTGLPAAAPIARPALVVKIDNAPKGRPQFGINQADIVYEEGVEGGITRLAAVFHSTDAETVGPVRSARSTDLALAAPLSKPLFAYSGANKNFLALLRSAPLVDVGVDKVPAAFRREGGRPAPYNLVTTTAGLFQAAPAGATPPGAVLTYRGAGEPFSAAGAAPSGSVSADWGRGKTVVAYQWDAGKAGWLRTLNGTPHVDAKGEQVAPANVVLQLVPYKDTGLKDQSGAAVPEAELVGEGEAWVLSEGKLAKGRWRKPVVGAVTEYLDSAGAPVRLAPGRTWIGLVPPGGAKAG